MAELAMENIQEDEKMEIEEEERHGENGERDSSYLGPNSSFLTELNLVLIVSYLSLSEDECLNVDEIEKVEAVKNKEPKDNISRLQAQKRKLQEPKLFEQRMQKFQTKIRDCRHCRKM